MILHASRLLFLSMLVLFTGLTDTLLSFSYSQTWTRFPRFGLVRYFCSRAFTPLSHKSKLPKLRRQMFWTVVLGRERAGVMQNSSLASYRRRIQYMTLGTRDDLCITQVLLFAAVRTRTQYRNFSFNNTKDRQNTSKFWGINLKYRHIFFYKKCTGLHCVCALFVAGPQVNYKGNQANCMHSRTASQIKKDLFMTPTQPSSGVGPNSLDSVSRHRRRKTIGDTAACIQL
jgi:hypothetical protein